MVRRHGRSKNQSSASIDRGQVQQLVADALGPINERLTAIATDQDEIKKRLQGSTESTWRNVGRLIISVGSPAAIISIFIAMCTLTFGALYQSFSHVKEETTFRTHTEDRLNGIEGKLAELRLLMASDQPARKAAQEIAEQVVAEARAQSRTISSSVLEQSGKRFVESAKSEPKSWGVALQLVDYRSHLNTTELPLPPNIKPLHRKADIVPEIPFTTGPNDHRSPAFSAAGRAVPASEGSYLTWEGSSAPASSAGYVPEYFIIDGTGTQDSISLDGATLRNVIFRDMVIVYSGGPLRMQNVVFANCTFKITHSNNGVTLANALLEQGTTSLSLS